MVYPHEIFNVFLMTITTRASQIFLMTLKTDDDSLINIKRGHKAIVVFYFLSWRRWDLKPLHMTIVLIM